jgi:hypothetical protein
VLSAIVDALRPEVLERAVGKALGKVAYARSHETSRRRQLQEQLEDIEARLGRLLDALADGLLVGDEIKVRLAAEKARKEKLVAELERLDHLAVVASLDPKELERDLKARVADVTAVLGRHTIQARQMLRKILADKIELEPVGSGRRRSYKFRGALTLQKLIGGEAFALLAENTPDCGGPNGIRYPLEGASARDR